MSATLVRIGILSSSITLPEEDTGPVSPPRDMFYIAFGNSQLSTGTIYKFSGSSASALEVAELTIPRPTIGGVSPAGDIAPESIVAYDNGVWLRYSISSVSDSYFIHYSTDFEATANVSSDNPVTAFSVAKNGNIAVQEGENVIKFYDTSGSLISSINASALLGTENASLAVNPLVITNATVSNTFLVYGINSSLTEVLAEINSNGVVLRTADISGNDLLNKAMYRYNTDVALGVSNDKKLTFVDIANNTVYTRETADDVGSIDPILDEVNIGYISYDIVQDQTTKSVFGVLERNTAVTEIILDGTDNSSVTDWTVYDADSIYWVDSSGDALIYSLAGESSTPLLVSSSPDGLVVDSSAGLGNVVIAHGASFGAEEAVVYDNDGSSEISTVQAIDFGNQGFTRSTIVPGTGVAASVDDESISVTDFSGETRFTNGVSLAF